MVEARKRSLENAKPAGRPTSKMTKIDAEQTIVELSTSWPTGMTEVRPLQLSQEKPEPARNCASDLRLVMTTPQKGESMIPATPPTPPNNSGGQRRRLEARGICGEPPATAMSSRVSRAV